MISPENNSNWVFDYGLLDDIPVPGGDLPPLEPGFQWPTNAFPGSTDPRFFSFSDLFNFLVFVVFHCHLN